MLLSLDWLGRLRLGTGIVLFSYVATHFLNHALGLISLSAMEVGRTFFLLIWRGPVGTVLLYGSLLLHVVLVVYSIVRRRTWKLPAREVVQLVVGLAIPPLLVVHVIANRGLYEFHDVNDTYAWVVLTTWHLAPLDALRNAAALVVTWLHGCLGMHMWLRLKPWYARSFTYLYTIALLLPLLALAGYASAGREVSFLVQSQAWFTEMQRAINWPSNEAVRWVYATERIALYSMIAVLLLLPLVRYGRDIRDRIGGAIVLSYPDGRRVTVSRGTSVLEASKSAGIPHASVCGGRGRCSTCRIRVGRGRDDLPGPSVEEQRVLDRVQAPEHVRLACQVRPQHSIEVVPLLPPNAEPRDAFEFQQSLHGYEQEIAIMFADLRSFTSFAEKKLPYDVVFVLNQYFRAMGTVIEGSGGQLDKFIGDGIMALFGLRSDGPDGCRRALAAARAMSLALDAMNESLRHDLDQPLRMGIGIHVGTAIIGEMGHGMVKSVTAIGDAVNTASRLEPLTKDLACQLVVSEDVARLAGVDLSGYPQREMDIGGRADPLIVYGVGNAAELELPPLTTRRPRSGRASARDDAPTPV